jgi:hypothetical protein
MLGTCSTTEVHPQLQITMLNMLKIYSKKGESTQKRWEIHQKDGNYKN